jgi:hypothetical protein
MEQAETGIFPALDDEKPIPGQCAYESHTVNMSDKGTNIKSFCEKMNCWTNCRQREHCTAKL